MVVTRVDMVAPGLYVHRPGTNREFIEARRQRETISRSSEPISDEYNRLQNENQREQVQHGTGRMHQLEYSHQDTIKH